MALALFSRKEKGIVSTLSIFAVILRVPLAFRSIPFLTTLPYGDDAFYLFSIAKHLAAGHGPTVDGVSLTNGFQPLIVLLYTPIFWLCGSNTWLAVRWTFLLNGIIAAFTIWAVAILLRTLERSPLREGASIPIIGAVIWTFTFTIFAQMTNGLETGLASLFLLVAMILYAKIDSITRGWALGFTLGFAVLARIDAAIFVVILVVILLLKKRIRIAVVISIASFLVSAPWWLFNWINFGDLMPTSGQAENIWPLPPGENIYRAIQAVSNIASFIFYLPNSLSLPLRILWFIVLLTVILFIVKRTSLTSRLIKMLRIDILLPVLLFLIILFFYYTFFFRAPHFLERYFQPLRIVWSLLVAAGVAIFWRKKIARKLIIAAGMLGLVFSMDRYAVDYFNPPNTDLYTIALWARAHPTEKIGMLQSGVAGFIAPNVINLDGKVNAEALRAHQQGRLAEYLRNEHFTYIADDKPLIEDIAEMARNHNLYFDSTGMIGSIQLMKWRGNSE